MVDELVQAPMPSNILAPGLSELNICSSVSRPAVNGIDQYYACNGAYIQITLLLLGYIPSVIYQSDSLFRYTCKNNSWRCNGLIGLLLFVCVCVCVFCFSSSGGDASVSSSSRAGAVLLHPGPAARSRAGAGNTTSAASRRTNGHDHSAWTDHHRTATARTGTNNTLF